MILRRAIPRLLAITITAAFICSLIIARVYLAQIGN